MKYLFLSFALLASCAVLQAQTENNIFSGLFFYDFTYQVDKSDKSNEFEFRRLYFTHSRILNDAIRYKFQADVGRSENDDRLTMYLKNVKVDWMTEFGTVIIGMQGMNVFNVQEKTWGYRFVEKSAMDQRKFASSADLGIGFARSFSKVHFSTLVTNGRGYKHSENDSFKKISTQLVYGSTNIFSKEGYNAGVVLTYEPYDLVSDAGGKSRETKTVVGVFAGWRKGKIRIGGEYDLFRDGGLNIDQQIVSVYAAFGLQKNLNAFLRFDQWDPGRAVGKDGESYIIAGVDYLVDKGFYIAPNFRLVQPQNGDAVKMFMVNFQIKF